MLKDKTFFAGKAKSIDFDSGSIGHASVGVVMAGEYNIATSQAEKITVISGAVKVLLPGATEWHVFLPSETFFVPEKSEYCIQIADTSSYLARYI